MTRLFLAVALLAAGCGVQPSAVVDSGEAPTGVASGTTLYFVDADGVLRPTIRRTKRLGTVSEALSLLLTGPGTDPVHHTEIAESTPQRVVVTTKADLIEVLVPLTVKDVTPLGIDQIVCTALGVHVQSGGARTMKVQVRFTQPTPASEAERTCPLIS